VSKSRVISASFRDLTEFSVDSYHVDLNMDALVTAVRDIFAFVTGHKPKFKVHGGSNAENLALQNIQVSLCLCCTSSACLPFRAIVALVEGQARRVAGARKC
jgi:hypothetical protein